MDDGNEGTEAGGSKKARNAVGMVAQEHRDAYQSLPASPELPSLLLSRALTTASPDGGEGAGKEELQAQKGEESEEARQGAATAAKETEDKKKDTEAKGMKEHVCGKCSGAFKTALGLKVHISKAHSKDKAAEEDEEEEEVPETQCEPEDQRRGSSPDRAMSQTLPSFKGTRQTFSCAPVLAEEPQC